MSSAIALALALAIGASGCATSRATSDRIPVNAKVTLTGDIYRPSGDGPFPAMVLLHGCSGIVPSQMAWAQWFQARGYVALVLDSFEGRGLKRLCGDSSPLTGGARAVDVYAAARYLGGLPYVDRDRIGALGWSHGGWTVLRAAALEGSYPGVSIKALIAFYPYCGDVAVYRSRVPLLMLLGAEDNWTPAEPCITLAEGARRDGLDVTAVVYPNAHHGFDASALTRPVVIADARRGAGATVAYNPAAHADAERQVEQFLAAHMAPAATK